MSQNRSPGVFTCDILYKPYYKMDFGDLKDDTQIKSKVTNVHNSINKIEQILEVANKKDVYDKLGTMDKVNYDLFLSYSVNTLYWLYLRTKGIDPNNNDVKKELNRIREYMVKAKQAHDRNTIRPKLDKEVSKRFVRNGLWNPSETNVNEPPNKKKKFK